MDKKKLNRFEKRRLRTRKKIQGAAIKLILEKGYDAVTIQEITDLADFARATFYVHYKDKDDLIWDVVNEGTADFMHQAIEQHARDESGRPLLYHALSLDFKLAEENSDLYRVIFGSSGYPLIRKQMVDMIAKDVEESIEEGLFLKEKVDTPDILAQFFAGAISQLIVWWLETPNDYSTEEMAERVMDLVQTNLPLK